MEALKAGQRWISETEPELGLGIVESVSRHQMRLVFPAAGEARLYAPANAPIKRVVFREGDTIRSQNGGSLTVASVEETDGLLTYEADGERVPEAELADTISFSKPEDRLIGGQTDRSAVFALRCETIHQLSRARQSEVAGFVGGRIDLIPHQIYIAAEVSNRYLPRVLLADEVGLGKTIEACMILHRLHLTGRAERILIVLPESLVHQWFVELLRRFNLWFSLMDHEHCESVAKVGDGRNPFEEEQLVICSLKTLLEHERWGKAAGDARWDMLVVDEAHHLEWSPGQVSPEYALIERLSRQSRGLLLLTATPEQLGEAGHFARLRLLDPDRYTDLERFKEEQAEFNRLAAVAEKLEAEQPLEAGERDYLRSIFTEYDEAAFEAQLEEPQGLLGALVDRHGPGRSIFRNTRDALEGFPQRRALPAPLDPREGLAASTLQERLQQEFDLELKGDETGPNLDYRNGSRIRWLADLLRRLEGAKVLLICRSREKVEAIHRALTEAVNTKAAVFHEALTLVQRDRNAAWFAEPEGAQILLCSEIGSEGRNFQFAQHLVLFDLPLNPELLEQRIGRLDRIGQTNTVMIHIPYLKGSSTELLFRWHHEGLGGIEHCLKGGDAYRNRFEGEIKKLGAVYHEGDAATLEATDRMVSASREYRTELERRLREGQDRLVARNSFKEETSVQLIEQIRALDADRSLDAFMNRIFDHFGVTVEDLSEQCYFLKPGQLFTDSFPSLPEDGTIITSDRRRALGREDIEFLSWDHPMVRGAMDLMLSSEQGNSSLVFWKEARESIPPMLVEAIFVLECVAPHRLHVDRFLPPTPIRILVDVNGTNHSEALPHADINVATVDAEPFQLRENPEVLQALVPELLKKARTYAREQKTEKLEAAMREAHARLDGEAERLRQLGKVNPDIRAEEIQTAEHFVEDVTRHIAKSHLRLDAVRLILQPPRPG